MEIITMISRLTLRVEELTEKQELGNGLLMKLLKRQDRVLKHGTSPADAVAELPFSLPVESMEELHAVEAKLADDMALQEQLVSNHVFDILLHNDQICMGESFQSPDWIQSQQLKFSLPCLWYKFIFSLSSVTVLHCHFHPCGYGVIARSPYLSLFLSGNL